ncbi:dihydrodipicolinate synthetase [Pochonia chlamydosporia 170]|uniref:Dihydrodipicolinate synthetase n=1 Tax=Pochonia chlamydosporia 170 TaxID=1380566 RepID=A0A179FEA6_METCM|nr:dihydrodipicolinate synthetase [Pochonia chlamydosporia 170]OAQ63688.1 dihydrodipicolinate synthetase [Pochonia chlamydosporia 170]
MSGARFLRLQPGVYAPVPTPFKSDGIEEIDITVFESTVYRIAKAGVGVLIGGTLGEGHLLSRDERATLIKSAKKALRHAGLCDEIPVITGIVGASVRECISQAEEAASSGADAVIVALPAYFAFVYGSDRAAVSGFFTSVADKSPLPLIIYNIPFAAGGVDLDAQALMVLSEHQNITGVKLTCCNIAKGHRLALHVNAPEYQARHRLPFLVLPGSTDYLLPALVARQHGCIGGPANLYPKTCMKLYQTAVEALETGNFEMLRQAQALQDLVTEADSVINKVGFLGIKTAMHIHVDDAIGESFRKPLTGLGPSAKEELKDGLRKIFEYENTL